ncbi:DEAD/DEAH box helicase [Leucobacter chironomi]|uniref:DEAD/DEAH box helicase n=1 Tax=Leucobacter chironomi TaxID=491918 RepID=UPI000424B474|nr:DEAD/DEAH box helicase [Leucobacter chironomi]
MTNSENVDVGEPIETATDEASTEAAVPAATQPEVPAEAETPAGTASETTPEAPAEPQTEAAAPAENTAPEAAETEVDAAAESETETPAEAASEAEPAAAQPEAAAEQEPATEKAPAAEKAAEKPRTTFADLGLNPDVLRAITDVGYENPSAIQAATIPVLLSGRDVVGLAQTGTGKTAAFALPILSRIEPGLGVPQAIVLAPTRELALQVCEAFESYASHLPEVRLLPVYGGQAYGQQLSALRRGVDIVVGTPGRVMDHLNRGSLDLSQIKYLVLDEADEMLKMGFAEDVETILADTPAEKQVALFSATMPAQIRRISQQHLNDPQEVKIAGKTQTSSNITQRYTVVSYTQKLDALTRILEVEEFDGLIVFTRTRGDSEQVAEKLRARGYSAAAINGDIQQAQRERTVQALKDGKLDILVATDVAARGLDVERISHVVNYDLPIDTESYVHRIGRTGRAGRTGDAISFVTPRERRLLSAIEKATKQPLTQMPLPRVDEVNATRLSRFDDAITAALEETKRIEAFRDIIDHYVRHHNVPEADVAAALAVVSQGETPLLLSESDDRKFERDRAQAARFLEDGSRDRARGDRPERGDRSERADRGPRERRDDLAMYRIEVGHRQKVKPGQIVGALANEGGLSRDDFGRIQIRDEFTLVELPKQLSAEALERLAQTRISGKLIDMAVDKGGSYGGGRDRFDRGDRGGRNDRGDRNDRSGGYQRRDRDDRGGYGRGNGGYDRSDRGGYDRSDRGSRDDRGGYDRGGRNDRSDRGGYDRDRGGRGGYDRDDRRGGYDRGGNRDGGYRDGGYRDGGNRDGGYRDGGNRDGGSNRADGKRKPRW